MSSGGSNSTGFAFDLSRIRDAADWTEYKRRTLQFKDAKLGLASDPWFVHGNKIFLDNIVAGFQNTTCPVPPGP